MALVIGTQRADSISPFGVSADVTGQPSATDANLIHGRGGDDDIGGGHSSDVIFGGASDDPLLGASAIAITPGVHDQLFGEAGDDLLVGGLGDNSLYGGPGDDLLFGGGAEFSGGRDFLSGGPGDDLLDGFKGSDTVLGGPGHDTFSFAIGITGPAPAPTTPPGEGNRDVILDFRQGKDVIDLSGYQTFFNSAGNPVFLGTAPFGSSTDLQVRYDIVDGHTIVQFRSAVNATFFLPTLGEIDLVGEHHLRASDFILA